MQDQPQSVSVSLGRRPVFDEQRRLWGYDLFSVGGDETTPSGYPADRRVAVEVAGSAYMGLQQILQRNKKIMVPFDERSILDNMPYALPAILAALKIDENLLQHSAMFTQLEKFKKEGYLIAIDNFSANPELEPSYRIADIFCLQVTEAASSQLPGVAAAARPFGAVLLATRVDTEEHLQLCRQLGFSLFEGAFFKTPETLTMRKLTSNEVARFTLLQAIQSDNPDLEKLAETIQSDASISFRLLAYLNSAAFGFSQKIKSIQHALSLLGWRKIKNWLRVILLADVNQKSEAKELFPLAAQRGKFLELIAESHGFWGFDPESLHLLGLFSLLDTMLGTPMTEIVSYLPLDTKIKSALCRDPNNEYMPLLELAQLLEEGRWTEAETLTRSLNLDSRKVKADFQAALSWATELTVLSTAAKGKA